jgi:hypothetical protein
MSGPERDQISAFYDMIDRLAQGLRGARLIAECSGRLAWPQRGVYFFFEPGEVRASPLSGSRVVRIGTHALKRGSRTTLWNRLSQHRGQKSGRGNHRGSVFRRHVGAALQNRQPAVFPVPTWGQGSTASRDVRLAETELESAVSRHIAAMQVVSVSIPDLPGPESDRGFVERNAIGLLSGCREHGASVDWLGRDCPSEAVRASGLWNVNHVGERVDPAFLEVFARYVDLTLSTHSA